MRKMIKQLCTWLLAVLLLCSVSAGAVEIPETDSGILPYYVVIRTLSSGLDISSSGQATCRVSAKTPSTDYTINLTCTLCKTDGTVVKSWSTSNKGIAGLDKTWYVVSGSQYQVMATATVYDSAGNYVDSGTAYSSVVSY